MGLYKKNYHPPGCLPWRSSFTVMFTGLIGTLFRMQILEGNQYQDEYMQMTEQTVTTPGIRGNIYDRNGYPLAYNELAYSVTIQDLGDYPRPEDRNAMIYRLVTILNRRGKPWRENLRLPWTPTGRWPLHAPQTRPRPDSF